jgi:acyl-CoA reductase-like NAD-dependent aldehyde dehydrogenase
MKKSTRTQMGISGRLCKLCVRAADDAGNERIAETAGAMKVADGFEPGAVIGRLIDMKAVEKAEAHIAAAVKKGAKVVAGGKRHALGGTFFEPTVLTDVTTDMVITKEETFGPVAPLYRFKTEEDAVEMANDTEFGLASYFYSRDIGRIWRVADALEYDIVGINEGIISTEISPFGGMKESGIGRAKARNTAPRSSSRSNTSAWAAPTGRNYGSSFNSNRYGAYLIRAVGHAVMALRGAV